MSSLYSNDKFPARLASLFWIRKNKNIKGKKEEEEEEEMKKKKKEEEEEKRENEKKTKEKKKTRQDYSAV